ncbi:MAG: quinate 5-dehydrogenase [Abditibacteriota bacterium]|nr:quinate 5-dehydrogenase [Abditibacteriota bacterium]MBP5718689.1 quinate 5-dehydrogenase [Abditibacteriota bacterium]
MKHVVSVSLGSSARNASSEAVIMGEEFKIERIGADGDEKRFAELIARYDGNIDAFGLGGTDRYICTGTRRYTLRDGDRLARLAKKTPVADGSGVKNTLERRTVEYLQKEGVVDFSGSKVLMVCAVDRFGMAQALNKVAGEIIFGDLMFILGVPMPLKSYKTLTKIADLLIPVVRLLPTSVLYPTGKSQNESKPKFVKYYDWADIVCGDFLLIRKTLPPDLSGKTIVTNTVTSADKDVLRERGLKRLVTTTPEYNGRRYGTNVFEAVMLTLMGKTQEEASPEDYMNLLEKMNWTPAVTEF